MVSGLIAISLLGLGQEAPPEPPATYDGVRFDCQARGAGGRRFRVHGATGTGRLHRTLLASLHYRYVYTWPDAQLVDQSTGFSGQPQVFFNGDIITLVYRRSTAAERTVLLRRSGTDRVTLSMRSGGGNAPPGADRDAATGICRIEAQPGAGGGSQ
jgi:hypothetical protein